MFDVYNSAGYDLYQPFSDLDQWVLDPKSSQACHGTLKEIVKFMTQRYGFSMENIEDGLNLLADNLDRGDNSIHFGSFKTAIFTCNLRRKNMENVQLNQNLLFTLAGEIETIKSQLKFKQKQLEEVLLVLGVDTYHQDPVSGVVYKIYKPDGTFIAFKNIDTKRTALPGEVGGTVLSKKEAQEQGFILSK